MPSFPTASAIFPSAPTELGRQWNDLNQCQHQTHTVYALTSQEDYFQSPSQVPEVDSKAGTNKRSSSGAITDMPGNAIDHLIPEKKEGAAGDQIQGKEGDTGQNPGKEATNGDKAPENREGSAKNHPAEAANVDQTPEKTDDSAQNPAKERTVAKPEAQEVKVAEKPEGASDEKDESAKASASERKV